MRSHILTLAFAALLFAGCSGGPGNNTPTEECYASSDCDSGKVCRASVCTVEQLDARALGFELTPPPSSTFPPQTVPVRELPPDEAVQIGLEPGVRVAGDLTYLGVELGPGSGRLKFKLLGMSEQFSAETQVENNQYETYLPAGRYDITFFPDDLDRPTRIWREVPIELDTNPRLQIARETVVISGTLSRTDAVTREATFVSNARVFAISRDTGVTSSTSITDETGNFVLRVPEDSGAYDFHVAPAEPNAFKPEQFTNYVPEATFEKAFVVDGEQWTNTLDGQQADLLGVSLGEYAYAPVRFTFALASELDGVDWAGTTVTLRTEAGRGRISIRQRVDESGTFELPLVVGAYDAVIRTPPGSPVASKLFEQIELKESGVNLLLETRERVEGTVRSPDGEPLANAQLTFEPTERNELAEQVSVVTDEHGEYEAYLELIDHRLTVSPSQPNLPRFIGTITAGDFDGDVEIPEPVLVWGTVFGTPAEAGDAEDWRELSDVQVLVVEKTDEGTRVVGEGQTDDSGRFRVFIGDN